MAINGIYGASGLYTDVTKLTNQRKDSKNVSNKPKTEAAQNPEQTAKSTQAYLNDLRRKYSDINITVVDFKNERQERSYMLGCSGGNNVAISSSIIEQMAQNPEIAAKYEKIIEDVPKVFDELKERIESDPGSKLIASGVMIDKSGKVTYWSVSSKTSEAPSGNEKMKKILEEKRLERKKQEKFEKERKEKLLEEENLEKIRKEKELKEMIIAKGDSVSKIMTDIGVSNNMSKLGQINISGFGGRFDITV